MNIRFISSLTVDDEERLAQTIIETAKGLLEYLPIGYLLRIETTGRRVFEHNRVPRPPETRDDAVPMRIVNEP